MKNQTCSTYFKTICSWKNVQLAFYRASKRKRNSSSYLYFRKNVEVNLSEIQKSLETLSFIPGAFRQFKITDPKERIISAAPFKDRIVHHAIMNVLEECFEKSFIFHTYACRKNKGIHAGLFYVQKICHKKYYTDGRWKHLYFLKLDFKKYFDSINHEVLKKKLAKLIGNDRTLILLNRIIDSYTSCNEVPARGLPIGNLTSQFFANLYLSSLDHLVLEELKPSFYVRYMDDMIVFDKSVAKLKSVYEAMNCYAAEKLLLNLKLPVYGRCDCGVPFLGKLIFKNNIKPLAQKLRLKRKKIKKLDYLVRHKRLEENKAAERITAILNDAAWNGK